MTTKIKHTPAVLRALAFTHLTGHKPKGIHWRTSVALGDLVNFDIDQHMKTGRFYDVKSEYQDLAEKQPMVQAARHLEGLGYSIVKYQGRRHSHAVALMNIALDGNERNAHAYRCGRWSIGYGKESGYVR